MPISLAPLSRRKFLGASAAGLASLFARGSFAAEKEADPHRLFLLSDTHIDANPKKANRGAVMYENMKQVIGELTAMEKRAAGVIINGDCAHSTGETGDYARLLELLKPVREAGMPVHLGMGNHDHRENVWNAFAETKESRSAVEGRQITILKLPRANVFVLDSLDKTNVTPGVLGEQQLAWLPKALDAAADKPAIVMVHHQLDERPVIKGLTDTKVLLEILQPRKQVKLLMYGHTHVWEPTKREDLHCVNLPTVAYVFKEGVPNGWVDLQLLENGAVLQLHCIKKDHPQHMERIELKWRS
ncbi:MAG TPA: metallophosphoesterase [Planctomycetota bacterium]|nr:metallophosphoesterase [Planctomycetota bacterium]